MLQMPVWYCKTVSNYRLSDFKSSALPLSYYSVSCGFTRRMIYKKGGEKNELLSSQPLDIIYYSMVNFICQEVFEIFFFLPILRFYKQMQYNLSAVVCYCSSYPPLQASINSHHFKIYLSSPSSQFSINRMPTDSISQHGSFSLYRNVATE